MEYFFNQQNTCKMTFTLIYITLVPSSLFVSFVDFRHQVNLWFSPSTLALHNPQSTPIAHTLTWIGRTQLVVQYMS
jgi:hypothetical protein